MSAIAIALAEMGNDVSGSDLREQPVLDRVRSAGVMVNVGHEPAVVEGCDAVTASTAVPAANVELAAARGLGIPTLSRAGMLASICAQARAVGVAGTHGKTTTTSMLMLALVEGGLHPSFIVGGDVFDAGTGAQWTGGEWLVVEADESDGTHLELPLHASILTNVDVDHLDHFGSFEGIVDSFDRYLTGISGPKVVCVDDDVAAGLAAKHGAVTYGMSERASFRAVDVRAMHGSFCFGVHHDGVALGEVALPLRGVHNVANALGTIAMAVTLGVTFEQATAALERFGGVARRFDVRGHDGGATFVDDYAHAFVDADVVVLTEIYSSGTTPIPGVTGKLVADAVLDAHPMARVVWLPRRQDMVSFLAGEVGAGDVCISMGCGDIASLPDEVLDRRLERRTA